MDQIQQAREVERERCAQLVDEMIPRRKPGAERVVLAIAANAIRRGRHLTATEQLANLKTALAPSNGESSTAGTK